MVSSKLMVYIPYGLHLRPVSILCNRAIEFNSSISIQIGDKKVNAKSVLGVLSAGIKYEDEIELICSGSDENEALRILSEMIQNGLGDKM